MTMSKIESFIVNENGVRWTKNRRGNNSKKWTDRITCPCGSTERFYIYTGEIIEQKLAYNKTI